MKYYEYKENDAHVIVKTEEDANHCILFSGEVVYSADSEFCDKFTRLCSKAYKEMKFYEYNYNDARFIIASSDGAKTGIVVDSGEGNYGYKYGFYCTVWYAPSFKEIPNPFEKPVSQEVPTSSNRHVHADLIIAWANGAEIEFYEDDVWITTKDPAWHKDVEYRIKPTKPEPIIKTVFVEPIYVVTNDWGHDPNLKLTFDPETNELLKAEVIKES